MLNKVLHCRVFKNNCIIQGRKIMKEYLFWDDEILIESINADIICLYVFKGKEIEKKND